MNEQFTVSMTNGIVIPFDIKRTFRFIRTKELEKVGIDTKLFFLFQTLSENGIIQQSRQFLLRLGKIDC